MQIRLLWILRTVQARSHPDNLLDILEIMARLIHQHILIYWSPAKVKIVVEFLKIFTELSCDRSCWTQPSWDEPKPISNYYFIWAYINSVYPVTPGTSKAEYAARRNTFITSLPEGTAVILPSASHKLMSNDIL